MVVFVLNSVSSKMVNFSSLASCRDSTCKNSKKVNVSDTTNWWLHCESQYIFYCSLMSYAGGIYYGIQLFIITTRSYLAMFEDRH